MRTSFTHDGDRNLSNLTINSHIGFFLK
ncbi:hypothetical protein CP8484711_1846A, partial [Chlamydia psittaci 84-8471/1]